MLQDSHDKQVRPFVEKQKYSNLHITNWTKSTVTLGHIYKRNKLNIADILRNSTEK